MIKKKKTFGTKIRIFSWAEKKNSILIKKQQQQKECVKQSIYIANVPRA